uniref:LITAF domain-containing protein n=1 Tax=Oncorhynchus kisutch TaxID=8019 RepID=A0A8C7K2Y7_ONCKI
MEKSQYGPPQDLSAPPYPGPPADYQGSGGGTAYPPQPGFQAGPQPGMYPPPPQYGTGMAQPTNVPSVTQVVVMQQLLLRDVAGQMTCPHCQVQVLTETTHTTGLVTWLICGALCCFINPGGGDAAAAAKRRSRPDDVSPLSGPGSDRDHTHPWTAHLAHLWSPLLLLVHDILLDSVLC